MYSFSLRKRIVGQLIAGLSVAWITVSALTYQDARREIDAVLDAHLAQTADLLAVQANHELLEVSDDEMGGLTPYSQDVAFQVWAAGGDLIFRSPTAPKTRLSPATSGFTNTSEGSQRWRVYSRLAGDGKVLIQMAESRAGRERLARRFITHALWPLVIGVPLVGLLIWIAVTQALQPLSTLRRELAGRNATDLRELTASAVPSEVAPLVEHLNGLFARIRHTLDAERRFTSQAAHELRTPLAAIRAQAESALDAPTSADGHHALLQVIAACDRVSRTVGQLLTLARMDEAAPASQGECLVDEIAMRVVADLAPGALELGSELSLGGSKAVRLQADPVLIEVLIRNIVDNAIRHGGKGCHVDVTVASTANGALITVTDDGAGVSADDLRQLGRTFFRASGTVAEGTGIGLSIVARIAERYAGSVSYEHGASGRGLRVAVQLCAPTH